MRELMTAYTALKHHEPERSQQWADDLCAVIPEHIYWQVEKDDQPISSLHNWTVYAAAGEAMRAKEGLSPLTKDESPLWGYDFFKKYMPHQLRFFTEAGMYRDPGDPLTYDLTTRIQCELALDAYPESNDATTQGLSTHLRNGALATLALVSSDGLVPFGGRSSQYHMQ